MFVRYRILRPLLSFFLLLLPPCSLSAVVEVDFCWCIGSVRCIIICVMISHYFLLYLITIIIYLFLYNNNIIKNNK